jgi:putative transposase
LDWFSANTTQHPYRLGDLIELSGITRSAYYQHASLLKNQVLIDGMVLLNLIAEGRELHPGMGLRQLWELYLPPTGRDSFIEFGMEHDLGAKRPCNPIRTTYSTKSNRYPNLLVKKRFTDVNQVWATDITYFKTKAGVTYYIFTLMDLYSRRILGFHAAANLKASNALIALEMALEVRNIQDYQYQLIHHSDRGTQYIWDKYTQQLERYHIRISMCRSALENVFEERSHGTIKNQYLNFRPINNLNELLFWLKKDIYTYNYLRPHCSLNKMTPVQYEQYISNIPINQRTKLTCFTLKNQPIIKNDPNQLSLFSTS